MPYTTEAQRTNIESVENREWIESDIQLHSSRFR